MNMYIAGVICFGVGYVSCCIIGTIKRIVKRRIRNIYRDAELRAQRKYAKLENRNEINHFFSERRMTDKELII